VKCTGERPLNFGNWGLLGKRKCCAISLRMYFHEREGFFRNKGEDILGIY
jgi:hypothetical protein